MSKINDYRALTCGPSTKVSEALARIGRASPNLFQIVISDDNRVLGTLTDGDIRRAMLKGITLSDTVDACMRVAPTLGRFGEDANNRVLVARNWFLPIVDSENRLDHVLVEPRYLPPFNRALVMAGGFGKRLGHLTDETPKPLLPVAGRPILDRVLEQIETSGVSAIHISIHYKGDQIRDFIAQRRNLASISFIEENEPLGTAGALVHLPDHHRESVLVVNGDVLTEIDFTAMHEFHTRHGYDGTIAVRHHETEIPFGVIRQTDNGLFAGIDEKPRLSHFVAAGLYYLSPEFIALTPRGRPVDMPELLTLASGVGLRIGLFPVHEYWKDVGRPGDLVTADQDHEGK